MNKQRKKTARQILLLLVTVSIGYLILEQNISPQNDGTVGDFEGSYSIATNCSSGIDSGYPFISSRFQTDDSVVIVSQSGNSNITFYFSGYNGNSQCKELNVAKSENYFWNQGQLHYDRRNAGIGCAIIPGIRSLVHKGRLYKQNNGDLMMKFCLSEKGLMLFCIPFWDSRKSSLLLKKTVSVRSSTPYAPLEFGDKPDP